VTIRPFRETDLDVVKAITVEAFDGVSIDQNIERRFGRIADHDWQWRKARHIDDNVAEPGAVILVAEADGGNVIGYITGRIDREAGVGFIPNMCVRAGLRGQGIGRTLIDAMLDIFRRSGLAVARIETLDQNSIGQHLYPACGFVEVARQIHFAMRL
jgi:ribosomal protein S18 acetylase RimI-like enzyme